MKTTVHAGEEKSSDKLLKEIPAETKDYGMMPPQVVGGQVSEVCKSSSEDPSSNFPMRIGAVATSVEPLGNLIHVQDDAVVEEDVRTRQVSTHRAVDVIHDDPNHASDKSTCPQSEYTLVRLRASDIPESQDGLLTIHVRLSDCLFLDCLFCFSFLYPFLRFGACYFFSNVSGCCCCCMTS